MQKPTLAGAIGLCALAGSVHASDVIFSEGFEHSPSSRWSANLVVDSTERPVFSRFGGRFSNEALSLELDAIGPRDDVIGDPDPDRPDKGGGNGGDGGNGGGDGGGGGGGTGVVYNLEFDLYIIDTWDGSTTTNGPDAIRVLLDGDTIFEETFANQHDIQSFREPDQGRSDLGFRTFVNDSIYRDISLRFSIPDGQQRFTLSWEGFGLQSFQDESWGIDNVLVTALAVPTPGSFGLLAVGSALAFRRRREGSR